ncbi:MAG: LPS export ABC transporter permease LptG [Betaproteobacteria bacterium SG8_39]|nr:MAG: LPS export ABC transporter permease LptG [Betaproteobacteria bacterium SG8_39]
MTGSTLDRYVARQIYAGVGFVLLGFLALFAFFDVVAELRDLGRGAYQLPQMLGYVLLSTPTHAYELLPIAVLIGALYALAQLAGNSEFTVMRAAGMSPGLAGRLLLKVGVVFAVLTLAIGEWIAPAGETAAEKLRMRAMSSLIAQGLGSGIWLKDENAFVNIRRARQSNKVNDVYIYELDAAYRLRSISVVREAEYRGDGRWALSDVSRTDFTPEGPRVERLAKGEWRSAVDPGLLDLLIVRPERMSAWRLYRYIEHLEENHQKTERYAIAMWKKLLYPVAALVMLALALPFAYMHTRAGMVGVKVFLGIMLGVFFHMLNSLFAHVGLLQNWLPVAAAAAPSLMFFGAAVVMMWWVERR